MGAVVGVEAGGGELQEFEHVVGQSHQMVPRWRSSWVDVSVFPADAAEAGGAAGVVVGAGAAGAGADAGAGAAGVAAGAAASVVDAFLSNHPTIA